MPCLLKGAFKKPPHRRPRVARSRHHGKGLFSYKSSGAESILNAPKINTAIHSSQHNDIGRGNDDKDNIIDHVNNQSDEDKDEASNSSDTKPAQPDEIEEYDYEDGDSKAIGNGLNTDALNNTKKAQVDLVVFNRVPKVGSQSLLALLQRLVVINGFTISRDVAKGYETVLMNATMQKHLIGELLHKPRPHIYNQHLAYINFTRFHAPKPIYINLVRDPIERIISWYYYVRTPWYYNDMARVLRNRAPKPLTPELRNMDLDTCVRIKSKYCQFNQGQKRNPAGDHRRQTLFFCGQNRKLCMPFNSVAAMQKAKRTVEEDYAVVGTWEDTNITLTVLEHYVPKFFHSAKITYYSDKDRLSKVNKNAIKKPISEETREILRRNLTNEIEFYKFCKQRLYLQYVAINQGQQIDYDDYLLMPEGLENEDGQELPFETEDAIQRAKMNVERDYAVVGSWEDENVTLTVLENYIPKYFHGAKKVYYGGKNGLYTSLQNKNTWKPKIDEDVRKIVRQNFTKEYEFYNFCKQRLYKQYFAIKLNED